MKLTKITSCLAATMMFSAYFIAPVSAVEINTPNHAAVSKTNFQSIWNMVEQMIKDKGASEVTPTKAPAPTQAPAPTTKPTPAPTQAPAPTTKPAPAPTQAPAPATKPTPAPTQAPAPTTKPAPAPTQTPAPAVKPAPAPTNSTSTTNNDISAFQKRVVELVNIERQKAGVAPLTIEPILMKGATAKAQDMVDEGYFSHTSPKYGSPFDMMKTFGVHYSAAGENIASGQRTPEAVMNSWMNSPGHRANILSPKYTKIGVGYAYTPNGGYHHYWVQWFTR